MFLDRTVRGDVSAQGEPGGVGFVATGLGALIRSFHIGGVRDSTWVVFFLIVVY